MINLHVSMGPGRHRIRDPCSQTRYRLRLRYAATMYIQVTNFGNMFHL